MSGLFSVPSILAAVHPIRFARETAFQCIAISHNFILIREIKQCIILSIILLGGRFAVEISYNKLWKLPVDIKVSKFDGITPTQRLVYAVTEK